MNRVGASAALRTFLAVPLCDDFLKEITAFCDRYRGAVEGIRWVEPAEVHFTLHFFGTTFELDLPKIRAVAASCANSLRPFSIGLAGIGYFPNPENPNVLWLGAAGETETLSLLQAKITAGLSTQGFPVKARPFVPHATVGRIRNASKFRMPANAEMKRTDLRPVNRIALYRSILRPDGAHYEILESFSFAKS